MNMIPRDEDTYVLLCGWMPTSITKHLKPSISFKGSYCHNSCIILCRVQRKNTFNPFPTLYRPLLSQLCMLKLSPHGFGVGDANWKGNLGFVADLGLNTEEIKENRYKIGFRPTFRRIIFLPFR